MARRKQDKAKKPKHQTIASGTNVSQNQCPNCLTKLQIDSKFCRHCGQEQTNLHIGFWELVKDFFSNNFNFDARLLVTLRHLLVNPGFLAIEFAAGRRAAYVPPVRLYLFISFVYFLVLGLDLGELFNPPSKSIEATPNTEISTDSVSTAESDTNFVYLKGINEGSGAGLDLAVDRGDLKYYPMMEHLVSQGAKLLNDPDSHESELWQLFYRSLSIAMFVLMPFFALLLWLFAGRPRPYYIDTLIFSIHFHAFAFIVFTISNLLAIFIDTFWLDLLVFLMFFVYLTVGLKGLNQLSLSRAIRKSLVLFASYSFFVGITLILLVLASVWFV